MRVVDFFSGIGGFSLGLERVGFKTVAFSEIDPYACAVLRKHWPDVPNLGDITKLSAGDVPDADLWCGGFPCQPFSVAGLQRGSSDERNLWPDWFRLIREVKPRWLFMENVPALLSIERGTVFGGLLRDLASCGYDAEWDCLPASSFGSHFFGDRVWIVASCSTSYLSGRSGRGEIEKEVPSCGEVWNEFERLLQHEIQFSVPAGKVGRVSDGVSKRVDRLRCLGNAIFPKISSWIGERIMQIEMKEGAK